VNLKSGFSRVMNVAEVPHGTKKAIDIDGKSILICHANDGFYAVSNICSHAQEKLECGRMSRGWIACPVHGARFELATGRAMNPPAKKPIDTFELRVVEDWIEILLED
jgi:3-phenylpropionate/trans-cinnamate dioxygenase ferredoxin component